MDKQAVTNTSNPGDIVFTDSLKNFQRNSSLNETGIKHFNYFICISHERF